MLLVWFALPASYDEVPEYFLDFRTDLIGTAITNECVHRSPFGDVVFKCVYELLHVLDRIHVNDVRFCTDKHLCTCLPAIYRWSVRKHCIRCNGLVPSMHVVGRMWRTVRGLETITHRQFRELCCVFERLLDHIKWRVE